MSSWTGREALRWVHAEYKFENLLRHVAESESWELWSGVIEWLEREDFLAVQAQEPNGFEIGAQQLETYLLPALVELGDSERFFQYILTAANLRGVASALLDPAILQALVRSGRSGMAQALVSRLPHPTDRIRGRAFIASVLSPTDPAFERVVSALCTDLDGGPRAADPQDPTKDTAVLGWCDSLVTAARLLAPQLRARWDGWIDHLLPRGRLADEARIAVAEGFFDADEAEAPELWDVLAQVESCDRLLRTLPGRIRAVGTADPSHWLGVVRSRLPQAQEDVRLSWHVGLALLAGGGGELAAKWRWLRGELGSPTWDEDLLCVGAPLWPRLPDEELEDLESQLDAAASRAVLRILVLEERQDQSSFERALSILPAVRDGVARTSLYLRGLAAAPLSFAHEVQRRLREVLPRLAELQYAIPPPDLRRALDLVARHLPHRLRRAVDGALAAPGSSPVTLRSLAGESEEDGLLGELFERTERYAAMAAANAAEGFELRSEILVLLASRLILRRRDLQVFEDAARRLLPEEEDTLRATAARALGSGAPGLTKVLCAGIRDHRLQLQARLEVLPEGADPGDLVAPAALYRAAVRLESVEDELRALGGLLREPRQPAKLAEIHFDGMRSLGRRVEALADLARHALRYQARRFRPERQDRPAAILPLKEALGIVESDDWLVSLAHELVTIGSFLGPREAVAEIQEALERVAGLEAVGWERREEALIGILGLLDPLFMHGGPTSPLAHVPEAVRRIRATELIGWVVGLPERMTDSVAGDFLRRRWHRFLPCLVAVGEHLESSTPTLKQRAESLLWRSPSIVSALRTSAFRARSLSPDHGELLDLCLASPMERLRRAYALTSSAGEGVDPEVVQGLSWLLSRSAPDRIRSVLSCLDGGPDRDRMIMELVRNAPLPGSVARELIRLLSPADQAQDWGAVWLGVRDGIDMPADRWLTSSAALVTRDRVDPGDPATAPIRRRLWASTRGDEAITLAEAVLGALALGGQPAGERAVRLFLNAYVQPRLGEEASVEARRRHTEMWRALERARRLETRKEVSDPEEPISLPSAGDSSESPKGLLSRFHGWRRSWDQRPRELGEEPMHQAKALTVLTGIAAVPLLPQLQMILLPGVEPSGVGEEAALRATIVIGLLIVINGLLIGSYLRRATPGEVAVRRPVRWVRTMLASVPIFGFWAIPLWRWLRARNSRWILRHDREGPAGLPEPGVPGWRSRKAHGFRSAALGRWAGRPGVLVALYLVNVAIVTVAAPGLSGFEGGRFLRVWTLVLLHGLFFGGMLAGLVWRARDQRLTGWHSVLLPALAVCWLVPIPALPLLGLLGMILLDPDTSTETLGRHALSGAGGVRGLPTWLRKPTPAPVEDPGMAPSAPGTARVASRRT